MAGRAALREQCDGDALCEVGGWWPLEARGERECVRRSTAVRTGCAGPRMREGDDSENEERKNNEPRGGVPGVGLRNEHQHKGADDCNGCNP
jgi:hypothetical protein